MQVELIKKPTLKNMLSNGLIADHILKYLDFDTLVKLKKAFKENDTSIEPNRSKILIVDYFYERMRSIPMNQLGLNLSIVNYLGDNNVLSFEQMEQFNYIEPSRSDFNGIRHLQSILDELPNLRILKLHTEEEVVIKHSEHLEEFTYSMQCKCGCSFQDWPLEIGLDGSKLKKLYLLNLSRSIILYHYDSVEKKRTEKWDPFPELKEVYIKRIRLSNLTDVVINCERKFSKAKILCLDNLEGEFEQLPNNTEILNNLDILFIRQLSSMNAYDLQKMFKFQKLLIEYKFKCRVVTDMDVINATLFHIQENIHRQNKC